MLEVKGISVAYDDIQVLSGVTLHVKEGEIVTLIGLFSITLPVLIILR